ncbi:MAG: Hint domain-containing protein [Pseudomonadota bacterium]
MSAIGQAGSLVENTTSTGEAITVTFDEPLTDPVIVISGTNFGGNKYSFRVIDLITDPDTGDATGFRFTIDEWENHDGPHPAQEQIQWLAIEEGVHELPDGRIIEAGHTSADSDGEAVALQGSFAEAPVVLTTVASDNDLSNVDSDPFNVTASGFDLNVEEAESQDGVHGLETVGWIAIQAGGDGTSGTAQNVDNIGSAWVADVDYGATFSDAVALVETQTQNDPDTGNAILRNIGNGDTDIRFEEDTSVDADNGHTPETVGLVVFDDGLILCFASDASVATPFGPRRIGALRPGDLVTSRDRGPVPLLWTAATTVDARGAEAPVLITAHAFGPGQPRCDTLVSPQHRILVRGWVSQIHAGEEEILIPAKALVDGKRVRIAPQERVTYRHLLFAQHEIVEADGLISESLHPGQLDKSALDPAARAALLGLYPDLRSVTVGYGPLARAAVPVRIGQALRSDLFADAG